MPVQLSAAFWSYDRTHAIESGAVKVEGVELIHFDLNPEEMFHRAIFHEEFDISELSLAYYVEHHSRGTCPYIAIPVFPARMFRHSAIYIRTDRGIKSPADLKGRRVGTPHYSATAVVWARGALQDDYGVHARDVEWVTGALEEKGKRASRDVHIPEEIRITSIPEDRTLSEAFVAGDFDAMISPRAPSCYLKKAPNIGRLWENFPEVERDYHKRTGIFPIMHVMTVRKKTLEKHPWLAVSMFKAWEDSKNRALADLKVERVPKIMLPWVNDFTRQVQAFMGADFWPYGADENRTTLEAFMRHHHAQGLSPRIMPVEELFVPATLERIKI